MEHIPCILCKIGTVTALTVELNNGMQLNKSACCSNLQCASESLVKSKATSDEDVLGSWQRLNLAPKPITKPSPERK